MCSCVFLLVFQEKKKFKNCKNRQGHSKTMFLHCIIVSCFSFPPLENDAKRIIDYLKVMKYEAPSQDKYDFSSLKVIKSCVALISGKNTLISRIILI